MGDKYYAIVDEYNNKITLSKTKIKEMSRYAVYLHNAEIEFKDGLLHIEGDQEVYEFTLDTEYVEDMIDKPDKRFWRYRPKTIKDLLTWNLRPCVKYWYKLDKLKRYESIFSYYQIVCI